MGNNENSATNVFLSLLLSCRSISIMKVAQTKLNLIGPSDMDMKEYKVLVLLNVM